MIFKSMPLDEAKELYKKLNEESDTLKKEGKQPCDYSLLKIAMNDIWFFTNGLQRDY